MLQVIVRLEKRVPREELHQDAADTPDVARIAPAHIQDDLRRPVMPRRYHRRVILVVECGRPKVNQADLAVQQHPSLPGVPGRGMRGGWDASVVGERLIAVAYKEDILGLQVGVDEVEIVEDLTISIKSTRKKSRRPTGNTREELTGKVLDLRAGERHKPVALQEIKHTLSEQICDYTNMAAVIETVS